MPLPKHQSKKWEPSKKVPALQPRARWSRSPPNCPASIATLPAGHCWGTAGHALGVEITWNGSVVQWFSGSVVQWFSGSVVQWFSGSGWVKLRVSGIYSHCAEGKGRKPLVPVPFGGTLGPGIPATHCVVGDRPLRSFVGYSHQPTQASLRNEPPPLVVHHCEQLASAARANMQCTTN